jgi:hypothetical protein
MIIEKLKGLDGIQKEALRLALNAGEITDQYALNTMQQKGLQCGNWVSVYQGIELSTAFVQQVPGTGNIRRGDAVRFRINPELKPILAELLFPPATAAQQTD